MFGCRASTWTVSQSLRAFHRADESCFLQEAVATHAAAEQGTLDHVFKVFHQSVTEWFLLEWGIGWLPAATWCKDGHGGLLFLALSGGAVFVSPAVEAWIT